MLTINDFDNQHANAYLRQRPGRWNWIRLGTSMSDLDRRQLVQTEDGRSAYAVYVHLLMLAARDEPRGWLGNGKPWSTADMADLTGIPADVIDEALPVLELLGWINEAGDPPPPASEPVAVEPGKPKVSPIAGFDDFWRVYPRKQGKQAALQAWAKHDCAHQSAAIVDSVSAHLQCDQWTRDGGRFIPHAATWLNGRRWEDEIGVRIQPAAPTPVIRDDA